MKALQIITIAVVGMMLGCAKPSLRPTDQKVKWTAQVTEINGPNELTDYKVGNKFEFFYQIVDITTDSATLYKDGANGKGELGENDDIFRNKRKSSSIHYALDVTFSIPEQISKLSQAALDDNDINLSFIRKDPKKNTYDHPNFYGAYQVDGLYFAFVYNKFLDISRADINYKTDKGKTYIKATITPLEGADL